MIAEQIKDFLLKGEVRNAVNMHPLPTDVYEQIKPFIDLGKRMGSLLGQLGEGQLNGIDITYYGDVRKYDNWTITSSILEGLLSRGYSEGVNLINSKPTAEKLGIRVNEIKSTEEKDYKSAIEISINTSKGEKSLLGTVFGKKDLRIVRFEGYNLEFVPEGFFLICGNKDRPGLIGDIGTVLGRKGTNIAHMTWARMSQAGNAIVVLSTDEQVNKPTLEEIKSIKGIEWATCVDL
jgi:D-3-phosphoglycerate dehydrogenase